jgi:xanthine dehydrogenase accessory factor
VRRTDVRDFLDTLGEALRAGNPLAVATIVSSRGSTPRKIGAKMIVRADGRIDFTLGGGPFEALVIEDARTAIATGESGIKCYRFLPSGDHATGQTCGGEVEVFIDVHRPPARVVLFGGGHVAVPVSRLAKATGFRVAVIDDRREFASRERFAEVDEVVHAEGGYARLDFPLEENDYVVIVTRCHETDEACLRLVLNDDREPAYVGVIASRRKARLLLKNLREDGYPPDRLEAVRSPIGLDIGAETPEEIAVSILGEILAERAGRRARPLSEETRVPENVTVRRAPRPRRARATRSSAAPPPTSP